VRGGPALILAGAQQHLFAQPACGWSGAADVAHPRATLAGRGAVPPSVHLAPSGQYSAEASHCRCRTHTVLALATWYPQPRGSCAPQTLWKGVGPVGCSQPPAVLPAAGVPAPCSSSVPAALRPCFHRLTRGLPAMRCGCWGGQDARAREVAELEAQVAALREQAGQSRTLQAQVQVSGRSAARLVGAHKAVLPGAFCRAAAVTAGRLMAVAVQKQKPPPAAATASAWCCRGRRC
jgi:hypothetical protein